MNNIKVLVSGSSGFIGFHLCKSLLQIGFIVIGLDNHNDYYDVALKVSRLNILKTYTNYSFHLTDIVNKSEVNVLFQKYQPDYVFHLAAQAGVRYSLQNTDAYIQSNIIGFTNIIEACKVFSVKHLFFASSSSVYGISNVIPLSEDADVDKPISFYAATKRANEIIAHTYAHLYQLNITGFRFFTVYGPYGRPDMAYFSFTKAIFDNNPIEIYNNGLLKRDFTYIDDVVTGLINMMQVSLKSPDYNHAYEVYNIGNSSPVSLMSFIEVLEQLIGKKAFKINKPMQQGDVFETYADIQKINSVIDFKPIVNIKEGLGQFVNWYKNYYGK